MTSRTSRVSRGLAAVVALFLLASCAGLPTSDTVEPGRPVLGQPPQGVHVLPDRPDPGADPEQIVTGFILANVGFEDDHEVARSFLTPELARQWRPTARVAVYDGDLQPTLAGADTVEISLQLQAVLDEAGYLTQTTTQTPRAERFGMSRVDGEWRISEFPQDFGLLLSRTDFERLYQMRSINYVSKAGPEFVADIRWFPQYGQAGGVATAQATALARAQLQPVPEHLRGAVHPTFPSDVDLAATSVPVDVSTGTAVVDLAGAGTAVSDADATRIWAQLTQTLLQAPGVTQVQVTREGRALEAPGVEDDVLSDPGELGFVRPVFSAPYALLRVLNRMEFIDTSGVLLTDYEPGPEESLPPLPEVPLRWVDLAADTTVSEFAAVSFDRTQLARWQDGSIHVMEAIGTGLTAPSFDRDGGLWVAGESAVGPRVWRVDPEEPMSRAVARPLQLDWAEDDLQIRGFRVSPDDTRGLLILADQGGDTERVRLMLTGIVRDDDGSPVALTDPVEIAPTLTDVADATWASATSVVILGQRDEDVEDTPFWLRLGGWLQSMEPVSQSVAVRAAPGPEDEQLVMLITRGDRIFTPEGLFSWESYRNGNDVVVPGF